MVVTLSELARLNASDPSGRRFELDARAVLHVFALPDSEHAATASELQMWFVKGGAAPETVLQHVGTQTRGGARIPDLTVWSARPAPAVWSEIANLALAVEIVSPDSAAVDQVVKVREYAAAGIPRYWVVERDSAQTVTLHALGADQAYEVAAKMPLAWLLQTKPADHGF